MKLHCQINSVGEAVALLCLLVKPWVAKLWQTLQSLMSAARVWTAGRASPCARSDATVVVHLKPVSLMLG